MLEEELTELRQQLIEIITNEDSGPSFESEPQPTITSSKQEHTIDADYHLKAATWWKEELKKDYVGEWQIAYGMISTIMMLLASILEHQRDSNASLEQIELAASRLNNLVNSLEASHQSHGGND